METKTLLKPTLEIIEKYLHFKVGPTECSIPYFNNKTIKTRVALRTYVGKGNPEDIREELESIIIKSKIDVRSFDPQSLKKLLTDSGLGIECSGLCYHILDTESQTRNLGSLSKKINFINCSGIIGKIRCSIRPTENCDVKTFADNANSKIIEIKDILPGDIITMKSERDERDHILTIIKVEYKDTKPTKLHYVHSVAYPEDGLYSTGVRTGEISIIDENLPITQAEWFEGNNKGYANLLFTRANKSQTEIRRLNWF